MANNYEQIMALVNAGNKMGLSNAITRDNGIPLDLSSVYDTYEDAVVYAATKAIAYQNQVIAAEGIVYVIVAESQGKVKVGEVEYDNYLKPVGTAPTGDNASINVTAEGLVSVFGFAGAQDGMLPVRENGVLTWKTLEAIGAGDGNDNTTYQFELNTAKTGFIVTPLFNGQPIYDGEGEDAPQIKYDIDLDVYTKAAADEKFLAKADYTPYDDTALAARVKTLEDEERYDETPLANRVGTLETTVGDSASGLVKGVADNATAIATEKARAEAAEATAKSEAISAANEYTYEQLEGISVAIEKKENVDYLVIKNKAGEEIASVDATAFVKDGMLESANYNTENKKLVLTWNTASGKTTTTELDLNDLVDTYTSGTGINVSTEGVISIDETVVAKKADLDTVKATAEAAQTAEQVDEAIEAAFTEANLDQYAKADEVNTALAGKADADKVVSNETFESFKTTNTAAIGQAKSDAVAEILGKGYAVATDVQAELDKKIEVATITHAVAADVEAGIVAVPEGVTKEGTTLKIVVDAPTRAETTQMIADKVAAVTGGESAAAVKLLVEAETERSTAKDEAHDAALAKLNGEATVVGSVAEAKALAQQGVDDAATANTAIANLTSGQVKTNTDDITAVKGRLTTLETAKGDHETRIATAEGKITALEGTDTAINKKIGEIEAEITELTSKDAEIEGLLSGKADSASVYAKTEIDTKVAAINKAITDNAANVYTKTEIDTKLANLDQSELVAGIEANAADIATLVGDDKTAEGKLKSIRAIAKEEVATIVGAAPEALNTLEEVATWITNDESGAAAMANDISTLKTKVDTGDKSVKTYVDEAVNSVVQPKASSEVTVAADGTLGIGAIDISKLTQTTVLVLDGGNAKV